MVDGHERGQVFKAVMREALAARPDLDVSDLALAVAGHRRGAPPDRRSAVGPRG